jgi:hypothetical protein
MATEVQICNLALTSVGANTIVSLGDNTNEARLCTIFYPLYRDYLLRLHPWNFAQVRTSLPKLAAAPAFGFDSQFQLPADCCRVTETDLTVHDEWRVEGRTFVCNVDKVNIVYTKYLVDPSLFDSLFTITLAFLLAWKLSKVLTGKGNFTNALHAEYLEHLGIAQSVDGMEGTPAVVYNSELIDSRFINTPDGFRNQNSL